MPGGKRLYKKTDIAKLIEDTTESNKNTDFKREPESIIYARVSSSHQKEDLRRQTEFLKTKYGNHRVVTDIGSGLNWKRPGIKAILEQCFEGTVREVVVTDKDRLCRFGFELLEWFFKKVNVRIVVHFQPIQTEGHSSFENELSQDILAVCNFFVAKNNGKRSQRNRKERDKQEDTEANVIES
jgi:predicted site-specific integrase-resolvase